MYNDLGTRQLFYYATSLYHDNNTQNLIALDFDNDERYVVFPKHSSRTTPMFFELKQV